MTSSHSSSSSDSNGRFRNPGSYAARRGGSSGAAARVHRFTVTRNFPPLRGASNDSPVVYQCQKNFEESVIRQSMLIFCKKYYRKLYYYTNSDNVLAATGSGAQHVPYIKEYQALTQEDAVRKYPILLGLGSGNEVVPYVQDRHSLTQEQVEREYSNPLDSTTVFIETNFINPFAQALCRWRKVDRIFILPHSAVYLFVNSEENTCLPNAHFRSADLRRAARKWVAKWMVDQKVASYTDVGAGKAGRMLNIYGAGAKRVHLMCTNVGGADEERHRGAVLINGPDPIGSNYHEGTEYSHCNHAYANCTCSKPDFLHTCHVLYHLSSKEIENFMQHKSINIVHRFAEGASFYPSRDHPEFTINRVGDHVDMLPTCGSEPGYSHKIFDMPDLLEGEEIVKHYGNSRATLKLLKNISGQLIFLVTPMPPAGAPIHLKDSEDSLSSMFFQRMGRSVSADSSDADIRTVAMRVAGTIARPTGISVEASFRMAVDVGKKIRGLLAGEDSNNYVLDTASEPVEHVKTNYMTGANVTKFMFIVVLLFYMPWLIPVMVFWIYTGRTHVVSYEWVEKEIKCCDTGIGITTNCGKRTVLEPGSIPIDMPCGYYPLKINVMGSTCLGAPRRSEIERVCNSTPHRLTVPRDTLRNCEICPIDDQVGATLTGPAAREAYTLTTCPCNALNGMVNRHLAKPGTTDPDLRDKAYSLAEELGKFVSEEYFAELIDANLNWLDKWSPSKRANILRSIMDTYKYTHEEVTMMVKREVAHNPPSKTRCIQFHLDMATQAITGPQVTAAQKASHMLTQWEGDCAIAFGCGMSQAELSNWMSECLDAGYTKFYERDGKNWDSTMNQELLEIKQIYYRAMGMDKDTLKRLDKQRCVTGHFRSFKTPLETRFSYKSVGTVKSGHNDTTVGNSIINAVITVIALRACGVKGRVLVCGDDCLVALEQVTQESAANIARAESALGIKPEFKIHEDWVTASFISGYWYPSRNGKFFFGPKIGRLLARLFWTVNPPSKKEERVYRKSVVYGLRHMWNVPIAGELICKGNRREEIDNLTEDEIHEMTRFMNKRKMFYNHRSCRVENFDMGVMLDCLKRRYSLDTREIEDAQVFMECVPDEPVIFYHPVLTRIMEADC